MDNYKLLTYFLGLSPSEKSYAHAHFNGQSTILIITKKSLTNPYKSGLVVSQNARAHGIDNE